LKLVAHKTVKYTDNMDWFLQHSATILMNNTEIKCTMQRIKMWNMVPFSEFASKDWPWCQLMGQWLHPKPAISLQNQYQEHSDWFAIWKPEKVSAQNIWKNELWRIWAPILNTATYLRQDSSNTCTTTGRQTSIPHWTDRNLNPYAWCQVCMITLQKPHVIFTSDKKFFLYITDTYISKHA